VLLNDVKIMDFTIRCEKGENSTLNKNNKCAIGDGKDTI
jgi:hypothetical protein